MTTKSHSQSQPKSSELKEGDRVVYHPIGGAAQTSVGVIKKVLTHDEVGSKHPTMHASQEEPRYVIENDHTHKETAYKREHIVEKAQ